MITFNQKSISWFLAQTTTNWRLHVALYQMTMYETAWSWAAHCTNMLAEELPAQLLQELSWCTVEELEGVTSFTEEVQQTISACLWIRSTLYLESGTTTTFMEQSMKVLFKELTSTMFPVLCVLSQHVRWSWWSQLRPAAQSPGQGSTMDTSCQLPMDIPEDPYTHVLIEVRNQFQGVMLMLIVHYSTTLRPAAMAWHALLIILKKSSHVLYAQSKVKTWLNCIIDLVAILVDRVLRYASTSYQFLCCMSLSVTYTASWFSLLVRLIPCCLHNYFEVWKQSKLLDHDGWHPPPPSPHHHYHYFENYIYMAYIYIYPFRAWSIQQAGGWA